MSKYRKGKVLYDFDNDIFAVMPEERDYDSSVQVGGFIFDMDRKGRINGFEVMGASKVFGVPKIFLKSIISGKMTFGVNENFIRVEICLKSLVRNAKVPSTLSIERVRPDFIKPAELKLAVA